MISRDQPGEVVRYSDAAAPARSVNLLFIHHSTGGQLLADGGPSEVGVDARRSIHRTHPNGGGLRSRLEAAHYIVHEASYGSRIGQRTDLLDWLPKFRDEMPRILATEHQDRTMSEARNSVILFKSCFPNSDFRAGRGTRGNPAGPELTLANAIASFNALREEFAKHPGVLFVYFTAPPLLERRSGEPAWRRTVKTLLGRPTRHQEQIAAAADARRFNDWTQSADGWLRDYPLRNVIVFDYFDLLTQGRGTNFLQYPGDEPDDDHPAQSGQLAAATLFVPFLNRAIRCAGIVR